MTVGELKELLKDLPDHLEFVVTHGTEEGYKSDDAGYTTDLYIYPAIGTNWDESRKHFKHVTGWDKNNQPIQPEHANCIYVDNGQ